MHPPAAIFAPVFAADWSLSPQWAFNRWLVALAAALAGAMVVYLYRAQQKVAPRAVVVTLTALRLALVLLAFVLLAGLGLRWKRTSSSGGTLWVVVDQSGSMARADTQATPLEKLRWAHALGHLPPDARAGKLAHAAARLAALRADLAHLRARGEIPPDPRRAAKDTTEYAAALRAWADRARALGDELQKEPGAKPTSGQPSPSEVISSAAQRMNQAADQAASAGRREDAAPTALWDDLTKSLDPALAHLRAAADAADEKFLAAHVPDAKVTEALAKASKLTRANLARSAALAHLLPRKHSSLVTFAGGVQLMTVKDAAEASDVLSPSSPAPPGGRSTDIAGALRFIADRLPDGAPAAVVVLSDGRHNAGSDLIEPARQLAARGVRVFGLAVGSNQVAPDAAVEQIDAPDWVYQDDTVRAAALLRLDGLSGKPVTVDFYRGETKVDSKSVTPAQEHATQVVSFTDKPPGAGVAEYWVRLAVAPGSAPESAAVEASADNNRLSARVAVKKDKLAVLVVEDQPRWEYRHLVSYLSRDTRVKLQAVLLQPARAQDVQRPAAVRASPKNEADEAQLLPEKLEDWSAFDLVVLGDVPKEALSEQDQRNLASAVRDRGTTLLLIAGPFNMPQRFAGTALADLIPVELSVGEWASAVLPDHLKKGFRPAVAPEGQASILGQFTLDEQANAALWSAAPSWYWHSEQTQAKRSAGVIWSVGETGSLDEARQRALLATSSAGMGRVMYLASDSTWRLRQVTGANPHERFWGQVIRWVVGNELPAGGKLVRFGTDKPRYVAGESVVVTARLFGEDFTPLRGRKVKAITRAPDGKVIAQADLAELPDAPGYYRASLAGLPAGAAALSLEGEGIDALLDKEQVSAAQRTLTVDVQSELTVEQRNVNADRATLARLAEAGGGFALDAHHADVLASHLPDLDRQTETVEEFALFANPDDRYTRLAHWAFLGLFCAIASAEWVIRKAAGLV